MRRLVAAVLGILALITSGQAVAEKPDTNGNPTIVLVHGAFAESSSWGAVIARLERDGFRVIAAANPLRGVASDGAVVAALARSIDGPVVLVGHSYGGPVITEAASSAPNVKALVYVAGFLPDTGESSLMLSGKFPGSTLGQALTSVPLPGGGKDLYISPETFHAQFAADVSAADAAVMAATQRPVAEAALQEPTGQAAWKTLPSFVIYGTADRNIPPAAMAYMAERARARRTVAIEGASHALMVSNPAAVAAIIEEAVTLD